MGHGGSAVKVKYRNFVPADLFTVREYMPFSIGQSTAGMVAYNEETAETLAIVIGQEWTKTSCSVHQIIINPMVLRPKYKFYWNLGEWFFRKAGLLKLYGLVPDNNWKALSLNEKVGFVEKCRLEDAYDHGIDYILMELDRNGSPFWKDESEMEKVA